MANALTGDFDAVAQVSVPAVNRLLAVRHQGGSFLHSFAVRVEDVAPAHPDGGRLLVRVPAGILASAEADIGILATHTRAARRVGCSPLGEIGILQPAEYTGVRGFAEVQVSTSTITLPTDQNNARVTVHYQIMAHFSPDTGSPALPEFLHGELQATVDFSQVVSQVGHVLEIDFTADDIDVAFNAVAATLPLSSEQSRRLDQVLRNMLRTRFQPVNATLPQNIQQMRFKTLPGGGQPAAALLLNLRDNAPPSPDPSSVGQVFLGSGDDFALAVGRDFLVPKVREAVPPGPRPDVSFDVGWCPFCITFRWHIRLDAVDVALSPGLLTLIINGRATGDSFYTPSFDFTVTQAITLRIVNGTVVLDPAGDPNLIVGGIIGSLVDLFKGTIEGDLRKSREEALQQAQRVIQQALESTGNLGAVLDALQTPAQLTYSSVEIQPGGLILHGNLSVKAWPRAHVEFSSGIVTHDGSTEIELNALNSWIPGGTIQEYIWTAESDPPLTITERDRFIIRVRANQVAEWTSWCLRVQGTRITASGAPIEEAVSGDRCPFRRPILSYFPNLGALAQRLTLAVVSRQADVPEPTLRNSVLAHLAPWRAGVTAAAGPNLLVHFADAQSVATLRELRDALFASNRRGAVFTVVVLPRGYLERAAPLAFDAHNAFGLTEDEEGGWRRVFGVEELPATDLMNPQGQAVWKQSGQLDIAQLSAALDEHLVSGVRLRWQPLDAAVREGTPAPDFLFEYAQDRCLALRRLRGRPVLLSFWTSWATPSLTQLRYLQRFHDKRNEREVVILGINDGESPERARGVFKEQGITFPLVTDEAGQIARLYGINCWPTTVLLDEGGLVRTAQFGLALGEEFFAPVMAG